MATWKQLAQMGDLEGVNVLSTTNSNEADTKYLRADGDGTCSWQTVSATIGANQTAIESIKNTSLVVGRDDDNLIKFSTDNQIIFEVSGGDNVIFKASGEIEATSLDISGDADIAGSVTLGATSFGDNDITNVGNIALDTISSDAGTSVGVTLGTDAGDDFNVGSGKLVVEGDTSQTGINTATPTEKLEVNGGIIATNASNRSSGEGIVLDYVTGTDTGRISVGDWGTAYEPLQVEAEKYTLDVGGSGNILAHHVNNVGDSLFMTSTGVGRIGANTISVADDTTVSIAGAGEAAMSHVYVYERSNGSGAIYTVNYHTEAILVTQDNVSGYNSAYNFYDGTSGTDGGINVYKAVRSHTVTFENKTGGTKTFKIMIVGAGQAPVLS